MNWIELKNTTNSIQQDQHKLQISELKEFKRVYLISLFIQEI